MVDSWHGARPIVYVNPYLADLKEFGMENELFKQGKEAGYFVKDKNGKDYMIKSVSINMAIIDLTNPKARLWAKDKIIKKNILQEARAGGWMHDFGEYLPFDAVLFDKSDPVEYHSRYVDDWAKLAQDAIKELKLQNDVFYFMRAGTATSPKHTSMFWMGDQLPTYDRNDGMHSALIGQLNGGLSGFTLTHSDIGGYTNVNDINGHQIMRNQDILMRWVELSTFSDVIMRSHPSNLPDAEQLWSNDETLAHLKKYVDIHVELLEYKQMLVREASVKGTPVTRPMMLHFPHDKKVVNIVDQFMLGENILVAPMFSVDKNGVDMRDVYLPGHAVWHELWTGRVHKIT